MCNWIIILLIAVSMCVYQTRGDRNKMHHYLHDRWQFVDEQLQKLEDQHIDIDIGQVNAISLFTNTSNPSSFAPRAYMFSLRNRSHLLVGNEIYNLDVDGDKYVLTSLHTLPRINTGDDNITLVKTVDVDHISFLLICFNSSKIANIYRIANGEVALVQSIVSDHPITNAHYFITNGDLHLIIAGGPKLTVFIWVESHFDIIEEIHNADDSITDMSTFPRSEMSEMVVVSTKRNSYVYEFADGRLVKMQLLDDTADKILTVQNDGNTYLILFGSGLYRWSNNDEFVRLQRFQTPLDVTCAVYDSDNTFPIIVTASKEKIMVHTISAADEMQRLRVQSIAQNFTRLDDMQFSTYNNAKVILLFGSDQNKAMKFVMIPMNIINIDIVNSVHEKDQLLECMQNLDDLLEGKKKHHVTRESVKRGTLEEPRQAVDASQTVLNDVKTLSMQKADIEAIESDLLLLEMKSTALETKINEMNEVITADKLIIRGGINGESLIAENLLTSAKLNGLTWMPEKWMSTHADQLVTVPYQVAHVKTQQLNSQSDIFTSLPPTFKATNLVGNLNVQNIFTNRINDIDSQSLYNHNANAFIKGHKTFNNIHVNDLQTHTINTAVNASDAVKWFVDPRTRQYTFAPDVSVKRLNVASINDVSWSRFSSDVFRIDNRSVLQGDVRFSGALKTHRMRAESISGTAVDHLLTTATPQTVASTLHFGNVIAQKEVQATRINGIRFDADVAHVTPGNSIQIEGPVRMETLHVKGNLKVAGSLQDFYERNHIIGTQKKDLLQIYTQTVRINGDMRVSNMDVTGKLLVGGNEFHPTQMFDDYWRRSLNQEIPVHFEAQNGIVAPHLQTNTINDKHVANYMLDGSVSTEGANFLFENVTVAGNMHAGKQLHPDLRRMRNEAITLNGTHIVAGKKQFVDHMTVNNLKAEMVNGIATRSLLMQTATSAIGSKVIRNLTVFSANANTLALKQSFNGIDLDELQEKVVTVNDEIHVDRLDFTNATVQYLNVDEINEKLFDDYVANLQQLDMLTALERLEIVGNITINSTRGVQFINNVNMPEIVQLLSTPDSVVNDLHFDGKVVVKHLLARRINDIDISELVERLYYRAWPQNITAQHGFKRVIAPNVIAPQINDINTKYLISVSSMQPQILRTESRIRLNQPEMRTLSTTLTQCNVDDAIAGIGSVPKRFWKQIIVDNVTMMDDDQRANVILRLQRNAAHKQTNTIIKAETYLAHLHADAIVNRRHINGIDLEWIANDALLHNTSNQVVTGYKTFTKLNAAAIATEELVIPIINHLNLVALEQGIQLDADVPVSGRKTFFAGAQTDILNTPSIGSNLVSLQALRPILTATVLDLHITDSLHIDTINNLNFSAFLSERLLLRTNHDQIVTGNYYFDQVQLNSKSRIAAINGIDLEDVVFDDGVQVINATKKFAERVEFQRDVDVRLLNGIPIGDAYRQSVLLTEEAHIFGDVKLASPSYTGSELHAKSINGMPFEHINELMHSENHLVRTEIIHDALEHIEQLLIDNTRHIQRLAKQYMYLDQSDDLQVHVAHAVDAQIYPAGDGEHVLHVRTMENGTSCGFASAECRCANQHSSKIPSGGSFLNNRYSQRVYTHREGKLMVEVITNTQSYSAMCNITSTSDEFTSVHWYSNASGHRELISYPERIVGYVTDVQFFTLDGHTYVIIAREYDRQHNTTALDSLVLRIAWNESVVEHVQNIRTQAATKLHLFHTAQAVNLIVCSAQQSTVDIYSFQRITKEFQLLRAIPSTGCSSAASVVLDVDSLIVLAQSNGPLQVLKYNPFYKSYYLHDSLLLDTPVANVAVFYGGEMGDACDAYLAAVSPNGDFWIYAYHYLAGWRLESDGHIDALSGLHPLRIDNRQYLFAASMMGHSSLLKIVHQGV